MYRHPDRGQVAGILEVIQTSEDMVFSDLVEILSQVHASPLPWLLVQLEAASLLLWRCFGTARLLLWHSRLLVQVKAAMLLCSTRLLVLPMLRLHTCGAAELWMSVIYSVYLVLHAMPFDTCTF